MTEYHTVRQGLDEEAPLGLMEPSFDRVELQAYWSTHDPFPQWLGTRFFTPNIFSIEARGRHDWSTP